MTDRSQIVNAARSLIGTPYHKYQSVPGLGIDCIGVLIATANLLNIPNCNFLDSGLTNNQVYARVREICPEIFNLETGCLLAFRYRRETTHCGILTTPTSFVHILDYKKVCEEELSDRWKSRIVGIYKFPSLNHEP